MEITGGERFRCGSEISSMAPIAGHFEVSARTGAAGHSLGTACNWCNRSLLLLCGVLELRPRRVHADVGSKDVSHYGTKTEQPRERTIPELRVGFHVCDAQIHFLSRWITFGRQLGSFSITRATYDIETIVKTP